MIINGNIATFQAAAVKRPCASNDDEGHGCNDFFDAINEEFDLSDFDPNNGDILTPTDIYDLNE